MEEPRASWWTLTAVCMGTFMLLVDISIINVALPAIGDDLDSSFSDLQWVVNAYALSLASLLLTAGSLADLVGRRRVYLVGLALFTVSSLLCGLAWSPALLTWARVLQGIGGAAMFATSLALLAHAYHGRARGTAFAVWGASVGAAVAAGPPIGGMLTEHVSWQSIFLVNLPIGLVAIALTLARVQESRDPAHGGVDWPGLVTFSGGLFLLVFALVRGNAEGWQSTLIVTFLAGAAVLLVLFVLVEARSARPMLDLRLFARPAFAGASFVAFAQGAGPFSLFIYVTLYLQNTLAQSPLEAGLEFLPQTCLTFVAALLAGRLTRWLPVRVVLALGFGLAGVGLLLMRAIAPDSEWTALLPGFLVVGAGIGVVNPALAATAVGVVAPHRSGMASGISNTFRQVGIAVGIAGMGALLEHSVAADLRTDVPSSTLASGAPGVVPPALRHEFVVAYTGALDLLFLVGALACLAAAALSIVLVRGADFVASRAGPEQAA